MTSSDTPLQELNLRYRGLGVRARSGDRSDLEWLAEFVTPQFAVQVDGPVQCEVTLDRDDTLYQRLSAAGPVEGLEPVSCFAFDNSLLRLPLWTSVDERRVIFDDKHHVFYLLTSDGSEVTALAPARQRSGRIPLMRIVREWAMSHGMQAGGLFLHASSFAVGDRAVVLAGEKSAGKTSLLIHALRHPATAYLSNDRTLVSRDEDGMTLTGMPTIATIRSSMLPLFPGLIDRLPTVDYAHHRSVREVFRPGEPMRPWSDGRYGLTPAQLTHMLDTPATGSARAAALVFPMVTDRPGRLTMRQVDPATAIEDLRDAIFGIGAWGELGEIFVAPADRQAVTSLDPSRQCRRLVEELPTFECELGREAYEDPGTIEALLEAAF